MEKKPFYYIDLFAGCGGLSLGLHNAGWKGLFAIEKNYDAFSTLKHNLIEKNNHFDWPSWLPKTNHDINEVISIHAKNLLELRGNVDMVAGGPPCQGFSMAGRRKSNDSRNELVKSYIDFVNLVQPKIILFENVKGFTIRYKDNAELGVKYSDFVVSQLEKEYHVAHQLVDFSKFGVPQKRCRFILVGVRKDFSKSRSVKSEDFFHKLESNKTEFFIKKDLSITTTLNEALSDLLQVNGIVPSPDDKNFYAGMYSKPVSKYQLSMRKGVKSATPDSHRFANHRQEISDRFLYALQNNMSPSNYRKFFNLKKSSTKILPQNGFAPTLTSLPDDYIHFSEPRILTVREYARIQSFPDSFEFKGKYTTGGKRRILEVPRYTQIGNAIPPLFGEQAGIAIKSLFR